MNSTVKYTCDISPDTDYMTVYFDEDQVEIDIFEEPKTSIATISKEDAKDLAIRMWNWANEGVVPKKEIETPSLGEALATHLTEEELKTLYCCINVSRNTLIRSHPEGSAESKHLDKGFDIDKLWIKVGMPFQSLLTKE